MLHQCITDLLPKRVELVYVDYQDSLEGHADLVQECLHTGEWYALDEQILEWYMDNQDAGEDGYIEELKKNMLAAFDVDEERIKWFIENHSDELREILHSRDESNILKDLLRNTRDFVAFYDTGYEFYETCFMSQAEFTKERARLRRCLGIVGKTYDKQLDELLTNASYGGRLVIYFQLDPEDFIAKPGNAITFRNPHIAIIDTCNGSGYDVYLRGHNVMYPFDRANLFLDRTIKYNYTYAICGMSSDWCEETDAKLVTKERKPRKPKISTLNAELN
jgi:hypothetical protein